ncbi:hypothetical protein UFOVP777_10 [uncultured Caudovirales phage]|uniref:Uncharacterized protein n=1 Tax=uncultured Caudovirales phage TaxID=2100421 RepID=A0A6J5NRB7_9CAUD|nr:hypothetical protein UFOVP777_10 [uncultured Caudovirales phage]
MSASNTPVGMRGELDLLGVGVDVVGLDKTTGNSWECNVAQRDGRAQSRFGFGTLARLSTTMFAGRNTPFAAQDPASVAGYTNVLASTYMVTKQGHEQLVTVCTLNAYSSDYQTDTNGTWTDTKGQFVQTLCLNVYDVTTDRRTELPFLFKTSDSCVANDASLLRTLPTYQTSSTRDAQRPLFLTPPSASLMLFEDTLYIVVPNVGVWYYRPVDPIAQWDNREGISRKYRTVNTSSWQTEGESSALQHMQLANGPFTQSYVYFTQSTWVNPTCSAVVGNRVVWGAGSSLYFSDPDQPNHIIAANFYNIASPYPISAMQGTRDLLTVFCGPQIFIYQPSYSDALQSGGRLIEISSASGPPSQNHTAKMGDAIVYVDTSGVNIVRGDQVTSMSEAIAPWFQYGAQIQNPSSSFKVANGVTTLSQAQPRARIDLQGQFNTCNITWHDFTGTLYITFADLTLVWRSDSGWSVWLYESDAIGSTVGITQNILKPWILAGNTRLFMVSGPHATQYMGEVTDSHLLVLEYGRGGSMDVTSAAQEDRRTPSGGWKKQVLAAGNGAVYFGRPIRMPDNWATIVQTTTEPTWLVPVYLDTPTGAAAFSIRADFDNTNWKFLLSGAGPGVVDFVIPNERMASAAGYIKAAMNATHQVRIFSGINASNIGNSLHIDFNGNDTGGWDFAPSLNIPNGEPALLMYLPMQRNTTTAANTVMDMGWDVTLADLDPFGVGAPVDAYAWYESKSYPQQSLANDALAQPIDWSIQTREAVAAGAQTKLRGTFMRVLSYGEATARKPLTWIYGPLNTLSSSDYRDYSGQRNDWLDDPAGLSDIAKIDSIRKRMKPLLLTQAINYKTGNTIAKWGSTGDPSKGNLLIDDPAVNTIATSEGVRGEQFSVLVHGSLCHPGEHVELQSIKGSYVVVGGRRRTGR